MNNNGQEINKTLYLIVGKSGSGKSYITELFGLTLVPSYTTRPIRVTETQGKEHIFIKCEDQEEFWKEYSELNKHKIIAWTKFNNFYYWTLQTELNNPKFNCSILDPSGIEELLKHEVAISREMKIIYFEVSLFKRIKYMLKRKDKVKNIISRIRHDEKIFNDFKKKFENKMTIVKL